MGVELLGGVGGGGGVGNAAGAGVVTAMKPVVGTSGRTVAGDGVAGATAAVLGYTPALSRATGPLDLCGCLSRGSGLGGNAVHPGTSAGVPGGHWVPQLWSSSTAAEGCAAAAAALACRG